MLHFIQWAVRVTCFVYLSHNPDIMFSSTHSERFLHRMTLCWTSSVVSVHFIMNPHIACIHRCSQNCFKCVRVKSVFLPTFELKSYIFWSAAWIKLPGCNVDFFEVIIHLLKKKEKWYKQHWAKQRFNRITDLIHFNSLVLF